MVNNLSQLKKALLPGTRFVVIAHCRPECIGQIREVTEANTQGLYSIVADDLGNEVNKANCGRGLVIWWNKASFWEFNDGLCSQYMSGTEHSEKTFVFSFHVLDGAP